MGKKFIILIVVILALAIFAYLWWLRAIAPVDKAITSYKTFVIARGEDIRTIAKRLQKEGLIRDPIAFFLLVRYGGFQKDIQSGDFRLSPSEDLKTIAGTLTHGTLDVWVTSLEGWRNEEIALKLNQLIGIPESDFLTNAREGYMFPDTYLIPKDASGAGVASLFLENFNKKVTPDIITKAKQKGLTVNDLIIIASLVEREAKYDEDRPIVASVILNRLKLGMKLDVDATVQYALGYQADQKSWWKKDLTTEDIVIVSPYNTYKNNGLPPGPVCNPGLAAIKAVAEAPDTNYLYYVSDKTGKIHPAKTVEEHNGNVQKYVNK